MNFLTQEQISEFKEAFKLYDSENKGYLTKDSLRNVVKQMGLRLTDDDVAKMFAEGDVTKSGKIEWNEFCVMMAEKMRKMDPAVQILEAFESFDTSGKGFISHDDMRKILTFGGIKFTEKEIRDVIKAADPDNDGMIDYDRFVKSVMAAVTS